MGGFEKELLFYVLGWLFRWLGSNEKNQQKKEELKKKGVTSK